MKVNRARIVGMGTLLSGITAAGVALSFRYGYMMVWRAIDGLAPALVVPAVQSIIAGARLHFFQSGYSVFSLAHLAICCSPQTTLRAVFSIHLPYVMWPKH